MTPVKSCRSSIQIAEHTKPPLKSNVNGPEETTPLPPTIDRFTKAHTVIAIVMDVYSFLKEFGEKDEWDTNEMDISDNPGACSDLGSPIVNPTTPLANRPHLQPRAAIPTEEDIADISIRKYKSALVTKARSENSPKSVRFEVSDHDDSNSSWKVDKPSPSISANIKVFYWDQPSNESNRFPFPRAETFMSAEPFTVQEQEAHPGGFEIPQFDQIWKDEPLHIKNSDVTISPEPHFRGAAFRVCFKPGMFPSQGAVVTRGTPIIFGGVSWSTTIYVVTWKRWIDKSTALVQVNAFLRDQRTYNPYSPVWPTFILEIPADRCFATFPPSVPRPPYIPNTFIENLCHVTAELEAMKKMTVFQFIYSKLSATI